jgi:hypothetical protein
MRFSHRAAAQDRFWDEIEQLQPYSVAFEPDAFMSLRGARSRSIGRFHQELREARHAEHGLHLG